MKFFIEITLPVLFMLTACFWVVSVLGCLFASFTIATPAWAFAAMFIELVMMIALGVLPENEEAS